MKKNQPPKKSKPTAAQIQARKAKASIKSFRDLMKKLGFENCKSDGVQFTFKGRTGEIDDIFVYENIIIIAEYTYGKGDSEHLAKKKILFDIINENQKEFVVSAKEIFPPLKSLIDEKYPPGLSQIRFIYNSSAEPNGEITAQMKYLLPLFGAVEMYFKALGKTIEKSARIEFLKFLKLSRGSVGESSLSQKEDHYSYGGYLLPDMNSNYPDGTKIVSFYADPASLIDISYVLRKDGWIDEDHLYQRILVPSKIRSMRNYLAKEKRVFVNNVIVTLPAETEIKPVDGSSPEKVRAVKIDLPKNYDTVGIIDGQHRVFCYHEGSDPEDEKIRPLRSRQHLLVTGLIFDKNVTISEKRTHEAKLFLEINDKQTRARAALKQDIEVTITPFSSTAISKRIIQKLSKSGIYNGLLQTHYFDPPSKIKTSSIVNYGLKPLVKLSGEDSLYSAWAEKNKEILKTPEAEGSVEMLEKYIGFCTQSINEFFLAIKERYGHSNGEWKVDSSNRSKLLSPTAINGLINCLRTMIHDEVPLKSDYYKSNIQDLKDFDFSKYRSSQWAQLGSDLFKKAFKK